MLNIAVTVCSSVKSVLVFPRIFCSLACNFRGAIECGCVYLAVLVTGLDGLSSCVF